MEQEKLNEILQAHKKWLDSNGKEGVRADLCCADLCCADLFDANLHCADLHCADLHCANLHCANLRNADMSGADLRDADLCDANLCDANLHCADLRDANLHCADLSYADLRNADLRRADLRNADMSGANMDYAVLPLWCGGLCMHVDDRIGIQLLYHAVKNILFSKNTSAWLKKAVSCKAILNAVNKFHRVDECGEIEAYRKAG